MECEASADATVSISFLRERKDLPPVQPGSDAHRVLMARRVEGALVMSFIYLFWGRGRGLGGGGGVGWCVAGWLR